MILNSYAVLLTFVALLRFLLGLLVVGVGASVWHARGRQDSGERREALEDLCYLVFVLTLLLVGLNLVSWPMLYLLLQSYVPEWPGVMCIYGVTQVGKGSQGSSRFLPDLLAFLQASKPALVFLSGAWFVLYMLNRRTRTGPLLNRLFVVLLPLGLLASAEAAAEIAYLTIPKKEEYLSAGCCVGVTQEANAARFVPSSLLDESGRPWLYVAYYGSNLGMIAALATLARRAHSAPSPRGLALLFLGGAAVLAISSVFLVEIAAPALLHSPNHHCAYDLIPQVPAAVIAVTLFLAGCFFLGWACVVRWFGSCEETEPMQVGMVQGLLRWSLWGYSTSLAMLSLELALA